MKTTRLAQAAAGLLGLSFVSTAAAESPANDNRSFRPDAAVMRETSAPASSLASSLQNMLQGRDQAGFRWKLKVAAEIRKHLQTHAPDLVPGFDRMVLELAVDSSIENIAKRVRADFDNATPEMRERVVVLAEAMMSDLMPGMKGRVIEYANKLGGQVETHAPDVADDYNQMTRTLSQETGLENLADRVLSEWEGAPPETRQRIMRNLGQFLAEAVPGIGKGFEMASDEIHKQLDRRALDLVAGYDQIMVDLKAEPDVESALRRLPGYWQQASPELRTRILEIIGDTAADLIPEIPANAQDVAAALRELMQTHAADLVPLNDEATQALVSDPALADLVSGLATEFRNASPADRRRVIEIVGGIAADLISEIDKS